MTKSDDIIKILSVSLMPKSKKYLVSTNDVDNDEIKVDEDTIIKYGIFKGKEFSEKDFKKILKEIEIQKLFNKCLNYLSYQTRSKHEIYAYLDKQNKDKKYSQSDFISIVIKLTNLGYVDDNKYTKEIISYYRTKKGKDYIYNFLKDKQISTDVIEQELENYDDEEEIAYQIIDKIQAQYRKYPLNKQRVMIRQKLLRDGFSNASINYAMDRITLIDESDNSLERDIIKLKKKYEGKDLSEYERKKKIISSLLNKGYNYSKISEKLNAKFDDYE